MKEHPLLALFQVPWRQVPTVFLDFEATGIENAQAVQLGIARFENGKFLRGGDWIVNPGVEIPPDAVAIHGITNAAVVGAPTLEEVFALPEVQALLAGAQPGAYQALYDREFVPPGTFPKDWPWLDGLVLVQKIDRFAKGTGRHKLGAAAVRHGIKLERLHHAGDDARLAGEVYFKLGGELLSESASLGNMLCCLETERAAEWFRFHDWLSRQPARPT